MCTILVYVLWCNQAGFERGMGYVYLVFLLTCCCLDTSHLNPTSDEERIEKEEKRQWQQLTLLSWVCLMFLLFSTKKKRKREKISTQPYSHDFFRQFPSFLIFLLKRHLICYIMYVIPIRIQGRIHSFIPPSHFFYCLPGTHKTIASSSSVWFLPGSISVSYCLLAKGIYIQAYLHVPHTHE